MPPIPTPFILTTPASRGIGFELVRQLLQRTSLPILATARTDVGGVKERLLDGLDVDEDRLIVVELDVTDESTIAAAAAHAKSHFPNASLRLALAVPGILHPEKSPTQVDYEQALSTYKVNTLGPLMLMKHFTPLLPKKSAKLPPEKGLPPMAVWATMSARVGSITDNATGGWYSYRSSKAGVNQLTKTLDNHLKATGGENAVAVALHPGTVKTDLSRQFWTGVPEGKLFSVEKSAGLLLGVLEGLQTGGRGKCWDWEGKQVLP